MKTDERRRDVLGTPYTEYEPRSGILYRLETPDQCSRQAIQHAVTVV